MIETQREIAAHSTPLTIHSGKKGEDGPFQTMIRPRRDGHPRVDSTDLDVVFFPNLIENFGQAFHPPV